MDRNGLSQADEICLSQEFEVLRAWTHPNIINAYDMYVTDHQIATVMDRCDGGTLMQRLLVQPNPHIHVFGWLFKFLCMSLLKDK